MWFFHPRIPFFVKKEEVEVWGQIHRALCFNSLKFLSSNVKKYLKWEGGEVKHRIPEGKFPVFPHLKKVVNKLIKSNFTVFLKTIRDKENLVN